ncbi:hypothetical protein [Dactylosporangium sp. NPDC051541]|uniref:hypothetical protein n=1 Tax=Dactylosporangium sp. NPDC051541 TaxID=3363977 RepID=UPI0037B71BC8
MNPVPALPRSRPLIISAWSATFLVAVQFAMVAVVPVTIAVVAVLRNGRLRALRWWTAAFAAAYAAGLALWAIGPDRAPSLSKNLHPAHAIAIVVLGVALAVAYHVLRRRPAAP